ncbi:hypothetical protein QFC21_006435 [Naganishia friedmannii]|uniref:Uncharacterized protein n=1 Tax=Naganishia friedmannii TaxID=89922 RepID=A0ACC2V3A1_9TREE|nr:hypothetical protein QFC21_006435 [Naganishia friedmannii]
MVKQIIPFRYPNTARFKDLVGGLRKCGANGRGRNGGQDQPGSKGWDAAQTRIATFVTLRDSLASKDSSGSSDIIHIVNTHYDDQGKKARQESSLVLRAETRKWVNDHDASSAEKVGAKSGLILLDSPEDEKGYKTLVSLEPLRYKIPFFSFQDCYLHLSARGDPQRNTGETKAVDAQSFGTICQSASSGPRGTYTGFAPPGQEADERIDVVLLALEDITVDESSSKDPDDVITLPARGGLVPTKYVVVDNLLAGRGDIVGWTGRWSDHRAVMVEISFGA